MAKFRFELLNQDVLPDSFNCGNNAINELVLNSYYDVLTQMAYTYKVSCEGVPVAYYKIRFRDIAPNELPDDVAEYIEDSFENRVTSIYIDYIAVCSEYQNHKIGTMILRSIIKTVRDWIEYLPIRLITLLAVNDRVEWYRKEGFKNMPKNCEGQEGYNVYMYMDCLQRVEELNKYHECYG